MRITRSLTAAAALATLSVATTALTAGGQASAAPKEVCAHWSSHGTSYIDDEGNDWTIIEAKCDLWLTLSDHEPTFTADHDGVGPGAGGSHEPEVGSEEYCQALRDDLANAKQVLAYAQEELPRALQHAEDAAHNAGLDQQDHAAAVQRTAEARAAYEAALAEYRLTYDTELEIETRNGNTVSRAVDVRLDTPEGRRLVQAEADLRAAEAAERAALMKMLTDSKPDAAAARLEADRLQTIVDDTPGDIEMLRRELSRRCRN